MCGIVGVWADREPSRLLRAVELGMAALVHRGPDDDGLTKVTPFLSEQGTVVLGHRRLSILDLTEAGHQPMKDPETGNWIIYNGEVFNFSELRRELEALGCHFNSDSDTEVILKSFRVWGHDCVRRWRGMFAAGIWDAARQELFLVRDRLGIKPLYYAHREGMFAFASELRALLATGLIPRTINPGAIDSYLAFGAVQDPLTAIEGVMSLPAAHVLVINAHGVETREYWEMPLESDKAVQDQVVASALIKEHLQEAVALRLVSDVPLGIFLSRGIDSNALAMLMRRASPSLVKAFTIGFTNETFDEGAQAKLTAQQLGVEHHTILLTEEEMLASCAEAVEALDQPTIDGINTFHISRAVRRAGVTVALSGFGGDEVFGGYAHFRTLPRMERFASRAAQVPFTLRRLAVSGMRKSRSDRAAKLRALILDDYGFAHPYYLTRTLFLPQQIAGLLEPEVIPAIDYGPWMARVRQTIRRSQQLDPINRISYLELKTYIANTLLRDADVMSMRHSLEVRVPLLDHVLIESVMRIPGHLKMQAGRTKSLLVDSLPEPLPKGVTGRPKRGFTLPFSEWLPGQMRTEVEETLRQPPSGLQGMLNPESVLAVWSAFLGGECSWTRPWALFVLYRVVERLLRSAHGGQDGYEEAPTSYDSSALSLPV